MQIDMHYYGTYAIARAAGLDPEAACTVATCAQFVDDNAAQGRVEFDDGSRIDTEATAHHPVDLTNLNPRDQRRVWVPFHFIPGNVGDTYTERLKCRMDSEIVREMRDHHLALSDRTFALELLGIAAHIYADTFSHYGFSGVSSRGNKVDANSLRYHEDVNGVDDGIGDLEPSMREYITGKIDKFFEKWGQYGGLMPNIQARVAETASGALGHGAVATLPDRPYLVWSFNYERADAVAGARSVRNNPITFMAGCRALHDMFARFVRQRSDIRDSGGRGFEHIAPRVRQILVMQADKEGRIRSWQDAAQSGDLFGGGGEKIPEYRGETWNDEWGNLNGGADYRAAMDLPIWRFYQAASIHRTYVIRDLLPKHGLIVD